MTATDRANLKVLIAEDCDDSAASLAYLLRADGHDVRVACDGPSAVAETTRDPPDVVILDIGLPGMDGFEVARQIVTGHADSGPLLIALSAYSSPEVLAHSHEAGIAIHLVKPADPERLLGLLRQHGERRRSAVSAGMGIARPSRA